MAVLIRPGETRDAAPAIEVLRRSIRDLCVQDHGDDPQMVARWLANKTETAWASWIARGDARVLVAEGDAGRDGGPVVLGVGMVSAQGAVLLNYVAPEARFSGVSKALLGALEGAAWDMGARRCHLHSTQTAARFYRAHGYTAEAGAPLHMVKPLHADARPRGAAPV